MHKLKTSFYAIAWGAVPLGLRSKLKINNRHSSIVNPICGRCRDRLRIVDDIADETVEVPHMKFILGDMWNKASSPNPLLKVLRAVLILPALAGAFACYTVFWTFFRIWPTFAVFVAVQVVLGLLLSIHATSFVHQLSQQTFNLENAVRILGAVFAVAVGFLWALPRVDG